MLWVHSRDHGFEAQIIITEKAVATFREGALNKKDPFPTAMKDRMTASPFVDPASKSKLNLKGNLQMCLVLLGAAVWQSKVIMLW